MKKIMMLVAIFFTAYFICDLEVSAHTSITDGDARMSNGYSPYEVQNASWNDRWKNKGSKTHATTTGKKLIYDIYSGNSSSSVKKKWQISNSNKWGKSQPYLQFWGWSTLYGHHHHDQVNQATYILAVNPRSGEEKMYKTEMSNLNATKDLEYNTQSSNPNNIWNKCGSGVKNERALDCNMAYEWVGFKAWIPLDELFPKGATNAEWNLYIVKNVEGNIVYDALRLPFHLNELDFNNGKVNLSSGINANTLVMVDDFVIRRTSPRGNAGSGARYFPFGNSYSRVNQDESAGTAIWYGVRDSGTRWASSAYWGFGGTQAKLTYEKNTKKCPDGSTVYVSEDCTVNVTIYHKDSKSGKKLDTKKEKATVGKQYSFSPKKKGVFKDSNGNAYVAVPDGQEVSGKTPNNNFTITFNYKASLPDPTDDYELDDTTEGKVNGKAFWELKRNYLNEVSNVYALINFQPEGSHYAIRNEEHVLKIGDYEEDKMNDPLSVLVEAAYVKNDDMLYDYSYEYTNYYRENYKCVDAQGADCFEWQFTEHTPVWEKSDIFNLVDIMNKGSEYAKLKIDHRQDETIEKKNIDEVLEEKLLIGRSNFVDNNKGTTKAYYEEWDKITDDVKNSYNLKTQTTMPIKPDTLQYKVEVPSGEHEESNYNALRRGYSTGFYYPIDVDDSLKDEYKNHATESDNPYAFPLQQNIMKRINEGIYEIQFTSDYFFMTPNTGFIVGYPYTEKVRNNLMNGDSLPTFNTMITSVNSKLDIAYRIATGKESFEGLMYDTNTVENKEKWQRYAIPISPESPLEPNATYTNDVVFKYMGLSDVTFKYGIDFSFEHFLFGSGHDEAWIIEQQDPRVPMYGITASQVNRIVIKYDDIPELVEVIKNRPEPKDRMHKFRTTDADIVQKLKSIVGDWNN